MRLHENLKRKRGGGGRQRKERAKGERDTYMKTNKSITVYYSLSFFLSLSPSSSSFIHSRNATHLLGSVRLEKIFKQVRIDLHVIVEQLCLA